MEAESGKADEKPSDGRPTCSTCPYADTVRWKCRRHAPCFGYPDISTISWCGDHPSFVALEESARTIPMKNLNEKVVSVLEDMLTRMGK